MLGRGRRPRIGRVTAGRHGDRDIWIGLCIGVPDRRGSGLDRGAEGGFPRGRQRADRDCVARDGVPALSSVQRGEPEGSGGQRLAQCPRQGLDGVRAPARDVGAGMPAEPAADGYRQRHRGRLTALARRLHADGGIGAAGRAHGQLAVLLAVEVQQRRPGDERRVEPARADALAADFLSHRHQQLERPVRQRRVLRQRHHRRDADSVVRAERRPVGGQPVAIAHELDPALGRIIWAVRRALAHHVQVPLEDHGRSGLAPGARRYAHDHVAGCVLPEVEPVGGGPGPDVLDHRLFMERRARNPGQRLEVSPARLRFDSPQCGAHVGDHRRQLAGRTTMIFVP